MKGVSTVRRAIALVLAAVAMLVVGACASTPPPQVSFSAVTASYPTLPGGQPAGQPYIEMPHMALRVDRVDVRTELIARDAVTLGMESQDVAAEEGYEFVVVTLTAFSGSYDEGDPIATIEAAGESHDITDVAEEASAQSGAAVAVFVYVPEGEPVTLSIADEDRTALLDLRTGQPAEDAETAAITAIYHHGAPPLNGELESTAVIGPIDDNVALYTPPAEISIWVTMSDSRVKWHAWLGGGPGWAPEGEGFVVISGMTFSSQLTASVCMAGWAPAPSFTLTSEGGEPISPIGASEIDAMIDLEGQLLFQVPLDVTTATLTLTPQTSVNDECEFVTPFEPVSIPVELG